MPKRKTAQPKRKAKSNATSKRGRKALRDIENEDRGEKDRAAAGGGEAINRVAKKRTRRGTEPAEVKKTRQPRRAAKPQVYKDVFEESEGDEADGGQCDDSSVENSPSPVKKSKPKLARPLDEEFYQARDWRSTGVIDY